LLGHEAGWPTWLRIAAAFGAPLLILLALVLPYLTAASRANARRRKEWVATTATVVGRASRKVWQSGPGDISYQETVWQVRYTYQVAGHEFSGDSPALPGGEAQRWHAGEPARIVYDPAFPAFSMWVGRPDPR
jgi:hypothetical protein